MSICVVQSYWKLGGVWQYIISSRAKRFCLIARANDYRPYRQWVIGIKAYRLTIVIVVKFIGWLCVARVERSQERHGLIGRAWHIGRLDWALQQWLFRVLFKRLKVLEIA